MKFSMVSLSRPDRPAGMGCVVSLFLYKKNGAHLPGPRVGIEKPV